MPTQNEQYDIVIAKGRVMDTETNFDGIRNVGIKAIAVVLMAAAIFAGLGQRAHAQQAGGIVIDLPEVRNYVALAAGVVPDYMGSDDYTAGVAPAGLVKFGSSERFARLLVTELSVNVLDSRNWRLGPVLNYRLARDDVDDSVVGRMRDIDGTVEAGVFGGWTWIGDDDPRHRFSASAEVLHAVGDTHEGYLISASARYFQPVTLPLTLSIGATVTYGSSDYMQTYFGVDSNNAARSGLSQFGAGGGVRDVRVPFMAIYSLSPKWHLAGGLIYSRLLGDASDSPIVDQRGSNNQLFAGLGIARAW
ncbi:MAG: MipA/OmpV family protein [Proteobacteria bacterium]|nr:MipA/OmpV family protein [Pseudomonadota bacterium]